MNGNTFFEDCKISCRADVVWPTWMRVTSTSHDYICEAISEIQLLSNRKRNPRKYAVVFLYHSNKKVIWQPFTYKISNIYSISFWRYRVNRNFRTDGQTNKFIKNCWKINGWNNDLFHHFSYIQMKCLGKVVNWIIRVLFIIY